jgi:pyruvate dehydrogenase E2 component (dihydrolipoamide acetyltransferase)
MIEFQMPNLGADMEAGTLIEWKKKPGDTVQRGDIIAEVETQKGLIEIEVFDEGTIGELLIQEGTKVPVGTVMALIHPSIATLETKKGKATSEKPIALQPIEEKTTMFSIKASPLARRIAAENHLDLSQVKGTGENGVITKDDVEQALATQKEQLLKVEKFPPDDAKTLAQIEAVRTAIAAAMSKSKREIPHYYLEKKIDITKSIDWLTAKNKEKSVQERQLPVVLLIKATAKALTDFPELNAVWQNGLQIKKEIHIGFVVSLRNGGIIVPAIHNADLKSLDEIMASLNDIIPRARALKLRSSELSDATITVTNIGDGGADKIFGVIYPPQVAIIGFGNISEQPFAEKGMLGIQTTIFATLAGDHRATDGLTGSRFLIALNNHLQNPEAL